LTSEPSGAGDWPARGADLVETLVSLLRDKTVRPLTLVARAVVFGVIVFAAAVTTVTLLSIALVRLLTVYAFSGRVWASDFFIGAVFIAVGAIAWTLRSDRGSARSTK
jgi:FtsH-binding integral membrane protein